MDSIILFHADWCVHSKSFMPIWRDFRKYITENIDQLRIVDYELNSEELRDYDIVGLPAILFIYADGKCVEFEGNKTMIELISFVMDQIAPLPIVDLSDISVKIEI